MPSASPARQMLRVFSCTPTEVAGHVLESERHGRSFVVRLFDRIGAEPSDGMGDLPGLSLHEGPADWPVIEEDVGL
jgi:hypothetical protein